MTIYRTLICLMGLATLWIGSGIARADTFRGDVQKLGNGSIHVFARTGPNGAPSAVGITFTRQALSGLPAKKNATSRCFDLDGNGEINGPDECDGDYELRLNLPAEITARVDMPFKWVGFNWNPEGHLPPKVYDLPHFDMHFYMVPRKTIDAIRVGKCEIFINCDDLKTATRKVAVKYVNAGHIDVKAAVSKMGNHLIDSKSPEVSWDPKTHKIFTHTFVFGTWDGDIIFYEPMITHKFLSGKPDMCKPIKQPTAWARAGYYPTRYCMVYLAGPGVYTISLEGMVYRNAG
jgi:hypothetical protein